MGKEFQTGRLLFIIIYMLKWGLLGFFLSFFLPFTLLILTKIVTRCFCYIGFYIRLVLSCALKCVCYFIISICMFQIEIQVLDENDNTPSFADMSRNFSVPETAPIQTRLGQILAADADYLLNGQIFYSLAEDPASLTSGEAYCF